MTQSKSTSTKKGILVATIGDLTGLLSGPYENIYYYINDHLGTPQMLTDSSAIVAWQADYDPFGKATVNDDPDGNGVHITNNIRFPGQYYDQETGLHYNWNRYYDPGIGRYLSPDPIGLDGGINLYVYVQNNPINLIDPYGFQSRPPVHPTRPVIPIPPGQTYQMCVNDAVQEYIECTGKGGSRECSTGNETDGCKEGFKQKLLSCRSLKPGPIPSPPVSFQDIPLPPF